MADSTHERQYAAADPEGYQKRIEEERKKEEKKNAAQKKGCYDAIENNGKYSCPECGAYAAGTALITTHRFNCIYRGLEYCRQSGGRKRRRNKTNKKSRQSKKLKKLKSRKSRRIR
jgi:hypothetical protein